MRTRLGIGLLVLLLIEACTHFNPVNPVPNYPVGLRINLTAEYPHFTPSNIGAFLTFPTPRYPNERVGYGGVLIYVTHDNTYAAFDLCCPHCLHRTKPLKVDGIFAVCSECGEHYDLSFGLGVPQRGISDHYLKRYACRLDRTAQGDILSVSN